MGIFHRRCQFIDGSSAYISRFTHSKDQRIQPCTPVAAQSGELCPAPDSTQLHRQARKPH
jgi:hypothetical protein